MFTVHGSELIILLRTLFCLSSEHVSLAMQATFWLGTHCFSAACMTLRTEFKVKTLSFIWINMVRCLLNVIHASSEKNTKIHPPTQHWTSSAFCHSSVCCPFTKVVVAFFPWCVLCRSIAREWSSFAYISRVQRDHLYTMCSIRDNRTPIPTVQISVVTTKRWWDNYAHTSWVCICLCSGNVINQYVSNLKLIHCYTMHISYYRWKTTAIMCISF